MPHTEPDYYHGHASLGCLLALSALSGLAVLAWGGYHLGKLVLSALPF